MRYWKIIGAVITLLAEGALQVSGFTSLPLAIILGVVSAVLFIWSAWPLIKRIRFKRYLKPYLKSKAEIAEKSKPKLKVEKCEFRPLKWVLKATNKSDDIAEDCVGILEMVKEVNYLTQSSVDMYGSRRLRWEDNNSILGGESALLCVIDIRFEKFKDKLYSHATPAYEKPELHPLALNSDLILLISLRSKGCSPLYTLCYCHRKNPEQVHQLQVIEANLEKRPTIDECREKLASYERPLRIG
jgi:hypothetical protein